MRASTSGRLTPTRNHDSGSLHHGRIGKVGAEREDLNLIGTRIDPRMDTLYARFRERRITRSEVVEASRQRRRNNAAG